MFDEITDSARQAARELIDAARLKDGDLVIVGCSTSEVAGQKIGSGSNAELGSALFNAVYAVFQGKGINIAAQCCEHLNRAIILEKTDAEKRGLEPVNVMPQPKAGGSFATAAFAGLNDPVAVEEVRADAGMDIGDTLIGMHLKKVAVPVRLTVKRIGEANLVCARTRPKFIGGSRACYNDNIK